MGVLATSGTELYQTEDVQDVRVEAPVGDQEGSESVEVETCSMIAASAWSGGVLHAVVMDNIINSIS